MSQSFVHLRLHTEYSLIDGLVRLKPLISTVSEMKMPAVAVTDFSNMFAYVKFQKAATAAGIKPVFGADLMLTGFDPEDDATPIVLLAKNLEGYRNLTEIISRAYLEGQGSGVPIVNREWVKEKAAGLICLSGGGQGELGLALRADKKDRAMSLLQEMMSVFPDAFYLELQRTGREEDETYLHRAVELAIEFDCPVVATNDVRLSNRMILMPTMSGCVFMKAER